MSKEKSNGILLKRPVNDKEIALVQMLANDMRPKDISVQTGKTIKTIENEIDTLRMTYGCKGRAGLIVLFFRNGLIK